ncbi:heterokaryon incompatibility protein-domain-containing protein [Echria macrotheca]|uniref:Heterokaryon incompatibility protein-domain-containing protein n=1 Tax=Echria macrotheca TaxID=438768 RepID=A0AAJ0B0L8_9PEZI|nr:heterokaryon incompatibility protein-domain-containing protein [Echria macrotheca]
MEMQSIISYLHRFRDRLEAETKSSFTFQNPHACQACATATVNLTITPQIFTCLECLFSGVGRVTDDARYVCSRCERPFGTAASGTSYRYSMKLDHDLHQAVTAAISGCELYRWMVDKVARYIDVVSQDWETENGMAMVVASCYFELYGSSSPADDDRRCVLSCSFTRRDSVADGVGLRRSTNLGSLVAWATPPDAASEYISSRPYERDVKSSRSVEFARACFQTCMHWHNWCRTDQISHLYMDRLSEVGVLPRERVSSEDIPTRLLSVGSTETDTHTVKLIETNGNENDDILRDDISEAGFMALSYCWGGDQPIKLLRENCSHLKEGIELSKLPQTLQDTVWVARATGFRYLWVDALCILQDDDDNKGNNPDKTIEISRMARYYGRATVTLCAASARKCVDGFLGRREEPSFEAGPIRLPLYSFMGNQRNFVGHVYLLEESEPQVEPTTERGWTLQESLLSRRILIFGHRQVHWSCLNSFGSPGGNITALLDRTIPGTQSLVDGIYPVGSLIDRPMDSQWATIVEEYTRRTLGRAGDKLLALSALAGHMVQVSRQRGENPLYRAGLLADQSKPSTWLPQLLWYRDTRKSERPQDYRAPSWSWASIDGPVRVPTWNSDRITYAVVEDCEVHLAAPAAPYGSLTGGHILLTAAVRSISEVRAFGDIEWGSDSRWILLLLLDSSDGDGVAVARARSNMTPSNLFLVGIMELDVGNLVGVKGLLVEQADRNTSKLYRRLGSFQLRAGQQVRNQAEYAVHRFFGEAERQTIRII